MPHTRIDSPEQAMLRYQAIVLNWLAEAFYAATELFPRRPFTHLAIHSCGVPLTSLSFNGPSRSAPAVSVDSQAVTARPVNRVSKRMSRPEVSIVKKAEVFVAGVLLLTITGCSSSTSGAKAPPLEVQVVSAEQKDVPLYTEWIGTFDGFVNADIKAEVTGYLTKQAYTEGSFVRAGQLLFQIDPRPFEAAFDQARGQLAQAKGQVEQAKAEQARAEAQVAVTEADQKRTQLDEDRYTPLVKQQAIAQQELDNATQNNRAARAQVLAAKAQVETAKAQIIAANAAVESAKAALQTADINLGFTKITSPIDGIPGIAQLQVGALVSPASGTITTVSTLDPIKVYFTVSEQQYLDFHRRYPTEEAVAEARRRAPVELILADGTTYAHSGRIYFADRSVDVRTGAIRIAALFPNPGNFLRPGQYAAFVRRCEWLAGRDPGAAARCHRTSRHPSGGGGGRFKQSEHHVREARRHGRQSADHYRRAEAGRTRDCRGSAKSPTGHGCEPEASRVEFGSCRLLR